MTLPALKQRPTGALTARWEGGLRSAHMAGKGDIRWEKRKGGKRVPYLDYRPYGRIYSDRDALGMVSPFRTEDDARRVRDRIQRAIEDGLALETAVQRFLPVARNTVLQRAQAWLAQKEREAEDGTIEVSYYEHVEQVVRLHFVWWENAPMQAVKKGDIEDWIHALKQHGLADSTVRGIVLIFRAFMGWAYDREELDRVPRFPTVRVAPRHLTHLTREEQNAVLEAIRPERRGIYLFAADTGARPQEARAIFASDLFVKSGQPWCWFRRSYKGQLADSPIKPYTKTHRMAEAPLTPRVMAWIDEYVDRSQPLQPMFRTKTGRPFGAVNYNRTWRLASEKAGVPVVSVREGTRHSTLQWVRDEFGLGAAAVMGRHDSEATTEQHYTRGDRDVLRGVVERMT